MPEHPHAGLMLLCAHDAMETDRPRERWEFFDLEGKRVVVVGQPFWDPSVSYRRKRIKPPTIKVNGFDVVAPESRPLKLHQRYYIPDVQLEAFFITFTWTNSEDDKGNLARGLVYLKEEYAVARAKAMIGINPEKDDDQHD